MQFGDDYYLLLLLAMMRIIFLVFGILLVFGGIIMEYTQKVEKN